MNKKQVIALVMSVVLISGTALGIAWGIINFATVKQGMSGTALYTQQDLNSAYDDGYNTALANEAEYEHLIENYRNTITNNNDTIAFLNSQVSSLQTININHLQTISGLQNNISELNNLIDEYKTDKTANQSLINQLGGQVTSLQNQVNGLLATVSQNINTISLLNNRIAELENDISYYEALVAAFQSDTKAIATFVVNNSTYNVQVVDKGQTVSIASPTNTAYLEFLGWTIDGENIITLSNYTLTANTTFIAKVINKYDVKFMFDGSQYASQIIAQNEFAFVSAPNNTQYMEFKGWSVDGNTIVDIASYPIVHSTTFYAVVTNSYDVVFKVLGETYNQQIIKYKNFATIPAIPVLTDYIFLGWSIDGMSIVDISQTYITHAMTFFAVLQQKNNVIFKVDGNDYSVQKVATDNYAIVPTSPQKNDHYFLGWSLDGSTVINISTYVVTLDTIFYAVFEAKPVITFQVDGGIYSSQIVEKNGYATPPNNPSKNRMEFLGWSLDGVNVIDVSTLIIINNTTFVALFDLAWTVLFSGNHILINNTTAQSAQIDLSIFCGENLVGKRIKVGFLIELANGAKMDMSSGITISENNVIIPASPLGQITRNGNIMTFTVDMASMSSVNRTITLTRVEVLG